jgi:sec-independent protein translocase protein TatA
MSSIIPLFPGIPGGPELLVILLIAILLFGANKIPKLARSSGEAIGEFQKGREEVEQELEEIKEGGTKGDSESVDSGPKSETTASTESEVESTTETGTVGSDTGGGSGSGDSRSN